MCAVIRCTGVRNNQSFCQVHHLRVLSFIAIKCSVGHSNCVFCRVYGSAPWSIVIKCSMEYRIMCSVVYKVNCFVDCREELSGKVYKLCPVEHSH